MKTISAADIRWMNLALNQAELAPHDKWKVGAVIVRGGSIISTGFNRYRNNPAHVELDGVSYHAEEVALKKAQDGAKGATLYVARVTKSGLLGLAKPCTKCEPLLREAGVHTVVWTEPYGLLKTRVV